jgi:hypothetical protein
MISRERDHTPGRKLDPDHGDARWPTLTQVDAAQDDAAQLLIWNRSLPAADSDDRRDLIARIVRYLPRAVRGAETAAAWHVAGVARPNRDRRPPPRTTPSRPPDMDRVVTRLIRHQ